MSNIFYAARLIENKDCPNRNIIKSELGEAVFLGINAILISMAVVYTITRIIYWWDYERK